MSLPNTEKGSPLGLNSASSLAEGLALRRRLYAAPVITTPSVMVIDVPAGSRGTGLALDRYYPVILESEQEQQAFDAFLMAPRNAPAPPDLFDQRPPALRSDQVMIVRYEPPAVGWPWLSLTRWPDDFVQAARHQTLAMARGCYTMEMFDGAEAIKTHHEALLDRLAARQTVEVRLITADRLGGAGRS